jgi:hypothetical protein
MKKFDLLLFAFITFYLILSSCSDEKDDPKPVLDAEEITIDATSFTEWVYISLSSNQIVQVSDPKTDLTWDLAFHRWDVRTNGGLSGNGQGAALQLNETELSQVTVAPESGYVTDIMIQINMTGMPPVMEDHPANPELAKWMHLDMSEMPPLYNMNDKVFVVRTADGNHAKLKFTDYMNDTGVRGHITFEYVLQPDGSRNF